MTTFDVVAIGEPLVEFNQTDRNEDLYRRGFGGDTSNAIIAAARSGARTAYVTRVGDDPFGRSLLELWRAEGVDCSTVAIDPTACTGAYFVYHGPEGHVFSYLRAGSAASRLRPVDLPHELLRTARIVHASGISMAISADAADAVFAAFDLARGVGAKTSFDPNLRLRLWPLARAKAMIAAVVADCDYFMPSIDDATMLSGLHEETAIADWAHRLGARAVLLKRGAAGAFVSDGARQVRIPGLAVNCVDATGAGDCFCGTALARLAAGDELMDAVRYATVASALSTTGFGAVAPLPRADVVRALLDA
jgi:2-dehydro-3-deoxygluconokinase